MYRLAIIDDEPLARQGIRGMLDWADLDISIVGEAEDGLSGKALVLREKPDILICDVRMPKLDGIAMVAQLRPLLPDLQIIFLSGHSEKAYLKSAIRFGAVDYLDKPVLKEELYAVVLMAKARVQEGQGNHPVQTFQEQMSALLARDNPVSSIKPPAGLPVHFTKPYMLAIFSFGFHGSDAESSGVFLQQQLAPFALVLHQACDGKSLLHPLGRQYIGYFNPPFGFTPALLDRLYAKALPDAWQRSALSISMPHTSADDLSLAYQQALQANRSFFSGYGRSFIFDPQWHTGADAPFSAAIAKITEQVEAHAYSRAADMLDSHVTRLQRCSIEHIDTIRKDMARLALFLARQYHPGDETYQFSVLDHVKFRCLCLEDIRLYLQDLLSHLVSNLDSLTQKGRVIFDVERYIQANYAKELSIADVAGQVYLTPTYLCYLYKKNTGKTLNAYMAEVKMKKAKEFLQDHSLKLTDIASMLGYNSPHYFTRIFTKHCGVSPSAYRNQHL